MGYSVERDALVESHRRLVSTRRSQVTPCYTTAIEGHLLTASSRQDNTRGHGTTPDDTGRHVEPDPVPSVSNLRIRWPKGRGGSSPPSRTAHPTTGPRIPTHGCGPTPGLTPARCGGSTGTCCRDRTPVSPRRAAADWTRTRHLRDRRHQGSSRTVDPRTTARASRRSIAST